MESDLDFIGASRQDRIIAEQIRRGPPAAAAVDRPLAPAVRLDLRQAASSTSPSEIPYLANRGGEALRALVTACVLDHDDITTLAVSIEGLKRVHGPWRRSLGRRHDAAARLARSGREPAPALASRGERPCAPVTDLFRLPCFPSYDQAQQQRIMTYLRRHHRAVRGWIKVVLGQGGDDPWATVRARMREVLLRTDLWSDQILVLRAVQTLTMLDVQHNCDLVWSLGGYTHLAPDSNS